MEGQGALITQVMTSATNKARACRLRRWPRSQLDGVSCFVTLVGISRKNYKKS
jgi:hypothetical protein